MSETKYKDLTDYIGQGMGALNKEIPDVMQNFNKLMMAAHDGDALDVKTKKLIALAIAVSGRCAPCIAFHTQALAKEGTTKEEMAEMLGMAIYMGGGPSVMYASEAWHGFLEALGEK